MTHKEMTKHIRGRIRHEGINARVRLYNSCGYMWIQVLPVRHDLSFSATEAQKISLIAAVNNLTESMGSPIDYSDARWQDSGATNFNFVFPG